MLGQIPLQDAGVGGGNAFSLEPGRSVVFVRLGNGEGDAAGSESQFADHLQGETPLFHFVQADDAQVGRSGGHYLRDVIVAHIQKFQRKIGRLGQEFPFRIIDFNADFGQ